MIIAVFFLGTLSAGLSSIFPILMITPLLIADYQAGKLDTSSKQFKILTAIACVIGLTVPVFGANPIQMQILSQVFNVFVAGLLQVAFSPVLIAQGTQYVDAGYGAKFESLLHGLG